MKKYIPIIAAGLLLAALSPLPAHAAPNTWNNGTGNFTWDTISANWTSPSLWAQGNDAIFGATGAGTITLGEDIYCGSMTFNASYTINANGKYLTNNSASGQSFITSAAGTTNTLGLSIWGTNSMTFQGTGTTILAGDAAANDANHYTGGTYIRSGTVILRAEGANSGSTPESSHAVDSIEALDAGATLQFGSTFNGTAWVSAPGEQVAARVPGTKMVMTGGTLDLNNDPKNEVVRVPDGFGLIINNGSSVQAGLNVIMDGLDHTFSGVIADGNNGVLNGDNFSGGATPQGPGYQIGIVSISGTAGSTWTLAGDNTYSGSTRIDGGTTVKLAGNHSLGIPTLTGSLTGPLRIQPNCALDLNGHDQTIALMTDGSALGKIYNSAVGTVSTLTVGYGNENAANRSCSYQFMDNTGVGGILAFRKIITQAYTYYQTNLGTGEIITNVVTSCIQTLKAACVATYSGDTSIDGGTLQVLGPTAISPNSAYRLSTNNFANLWLNYDGDAPVRQLWINGVQQPNGIYGAGTPGIDPTSTGTITVTGSTAPNTWNNGTGNFVWDTTSANWTSPSMWVQGDNALFGSTGAGTITLGEDIAAVDMTFNASYTINANGKYFTNNSASGQSFITSAAGTTNTLGLSIWGTNSMTFQGDGTTILAGDAAANDANHYTGGTYIRSGTVILQAAGASASSAAESSHAVDSIEALDTGATLQFGSIFNGTAWESAPGEQIAARVPGTKMIMTGGTLDLNNDPKNEVVRVPDGFGLIINNGSTVQAGLNVIMDGLDHTFSGVIADGNNGELIGDNSVQGPGYQIGIVSISGTAGSTWTLAGDNTYSGSTRIDGSTTVKLAGNHSLGIPTLTGSLTGPLRIQNGSALDLNGRDQTIALMTDGQAGGRIYNSAVGTVATLTVGYGMEQASRNCSYQLMDNTGTGGILAFKKINTIPYMRNGVLVTNCVQGLRPGCNATYSGDTTIEGGTLDVQGPTAISPNSAYRLSTNNYALLKLNYDGTANARQLWINGVQQPNGVYGAGTAGIDPESTGTITITGSTAVSQPTLGFSKSGNALTFSWTGSFKLQAQTNSLSIGISNNWGDYPGGSASPVPVTINASSPTVFFRLAPLP